MRKYKVSSEANWAPPSMASRWGKEAGVGKIGKKGGRLSRNSERVRKSEKCCGRREQRRGGRDHVDPGRGCP